MKGVATTG